MVETRRRDERRPVMTHSGRAAPAPPPRNVTTEQVSLSLESLVEELANHVEPEKRPQVELLRRLAREKPDQHAKVKEQMLRIGGPEAMKAAIAALLGSTRKTPSPPPQAPPPPPLPPTMSWPDGNEPPMPPNLPAIFGSTASTPEELQAFKSELLHAFHCRTPSCPISGCCDLSTKLQRLQVHVATCKEDTCLLCGIASYLRSYNAAVSSTGADGASGAVDPLGMANTSLLYMNELLASRQRLPTYDPETGKVSWMNPRDAMEAIRGLSGLPGVPGLPMPLTGAPSAADAGAGAEPSAKRARGAGGDGSFTALGAYPALHQGVLGAPQGPTSWGMQAFPEFGGAGGPMPRVPHDSAASGARRSGGDAGEPRDFASMAAEMVNGIGGMYEPFGGRVLGKRRGGAGGSAGGASAVGSAGGAGGADRGFDGSLPPLGADFPLPLAKSRSQFGMSSSALNLQDLIKTNSLSDLGLGMLNGGSMADLGSDIGLTLAKSKSELKEANGSAFSLSGLLGEGASEIVSGLGKTTREANLSGGLSMRASGASDVGGAGARSEGLLDIMGDFGPAPSSGAISAK